MKQLIVAALLLLAIPAIAQYDKNPRVVSQSSQVFNNTNCSDTDTCDLLQVRYKAEDYEIWVGDSMSYGTRLFAHYVTDSVEALENYAFVQFIKGCRFYSSANGEIFLGMTDMNFGKMTTVDYKNWTIESIDTDPIYFSTSKSRHFSYKWNSVQGSVDRNTEKYYGIEKPHYPELYITDIPGPAFYMNKNAKNTPLAFKTCLYKTVDVPRETTPDDINFAEPLYCFYWYSSWIYDHDAERFANPYNISPACSE